MIGFIVSCKNFSYNPKPKKSETIPKESDKVNLDSISLTDTSFKARPDPSRTGLDEVNELRPDPSKTNEDIETIPPGSASNNTDNKKSSNTAPEASIAYAYKNKMKKGEKSLIQMHVEINKPINDVILGLKNTLDEQKAVETGSSDTSLIKSLRIAGDKYFHVNIKYDTAIFEIEKIDGEEKQELIFNTINKWIWRVTAKKETKYSDIIIIVRTEDESGKIHERDNGILPIQITVDSTGSFFAPFGWLIISVLAIILLAFAFQKWRITNHKTELKSRIYFSYAWGNESESLIDKLYASLKKDGFNVVRDKANLKYKGVISNFMKDIGKGNIVIVAISDKYLKSRFCMFELYEVYRNCGLNKEDFMKKVFPIREEDINLSDASVIDHYDKFWKAEELKWEALIKDKSQNITTEQFAQYEIIRRIVSEIVNLLYFLSDINALDPELLAKNDFLEFKSVLRTSMNNLSKV